MAAEAALHERLWQESLDLARACREHPFVRGLEDSTLPAEVFAGYVAQDAFFLRSFLAAYCLLAARSAERTDRVARFHRLIGGVLEELELHTGYAARLGIDLARVRPLPSTSAYTDFLERTAWSAPLGETVAAMTPCMRLYAFLGRELAPAAPDHPYRQWIETYASDGFEALAAELESLLDEMAADTPAIRDAYRYAMTCERDFFSGALAGGRS